MRKKSHISLAGQIMQGLELHDVFYHKYMFYAGSILPDCKPSFLTTPHNFQQTFEEVKDMVRKLIICYQPGDILNRRYCIRLGEVIHYIADYFTFPHNSNYDGNLKDHCFYEEKLKQELRRYIRSGEAMEQRKDLTVYENAEDLFAYITAAHEEYMSRKSVVINDCHYIVRVCMEVVASIIAMLHKSFAVMRMTIAQPIESL